MSDVSALIASLPSDITNGLPGHNTHSETYKAIFEELARGTSTWVPLSRHGAQKGGAFDNTAAISSAIEEAQETGAPGVVDDIIDADDEHLHMEGRVDFVDKDLIGQGPDNTIFEMHEAGAGIDFNEYYATRQYTGLSGHFGVWGGPGADAGIATTPLAIGLRVNARFSNIHSFYADPSNGINLLLTTLQNSMLDTIWCADAAVNTRFDAGCSSNLFAKGEMLGARQSNLEFRAVLPSTPGQFSYNLNNIVQDTIIEGSYESTQHMVHATASHMNMLRKCWITNNAFAGGSPPTAMDQLVLAEATESVQAQLVITDPTINGNNAADVGVAGESGGRIFLDGGTFANLPLGMRGDVRVGRWPWMFSSVTQWIDYAGLFPSIPMTEIGTLEAHIVEDLVQNILVAYERGGAHFAMLLDALGTMRLGDGSSSADTFVGRTAPGTWGTASAAHVLRTGRGSTGSRPSAVTVGSGASYFDTTLAKPIWSDGAVWRLADGTAA